MNKAVENWKEVRRAASYHPETTMRGDALCAEVERLEAELSHTEERIEAMRDEEKKKHTQLRATVIKAEELLIGVVGAVDKTKMLLTIEEMAGLARDRITGLEAENDNFYAKVKIFEAENKRLRNALEFIEEEVKGGREISMFSDDILDLMEEALNKKKAADGK